MSGGQRFGPGSERPPIAIGALAAVLLVAASTAVIYPLSEVAPVEALGVVYIVGVLLVASLWGGWLGAATALLSAVAFSWSHIPPTGGLAIEEGENWVALAVFFAAAVLASSLSDHARTRAQEAEQRRQEADLAADMARLLLRGERVADALAILSRRLASELELGSASIELGAVAADAGGGQALALHDDRRQIATLLLPAGLTALELGRLRERVIPALEALLAAALEREALQAEVVETDALRRSDDLKTALLRSVSHDLRSPLTAILAASEALRATSLTDAERDELVDDVAAQAERLSRLIDKLLDLSRLEGNVAPPRVDWCSVEEVLEAAIEEVDAAPGRFVLSVDPELPPVRADAAQLGRAFANLLENAEHHCDGHPVSVRARAVGDRLVARIVDRGPGIAATEVERIFEPFYRGPQDGDASRQRGSGLGLAITRGFVEANGGRVWVESLPGQGSSFVVELPLDEVAA